MFRRHSCSSSTNKREIRTKSQSPILDYGWACGGGVRCGGGGVRRRATKAAAAACGGSVWLLSPQLPGGAYDESSLIDIAAGVFVSGHKFFYVCDFRTKHKICILAYHNLCFCVFVFLGMLHHCKTDGCWALLSILTCSVPSARQICLLGTALGTEQVQQALDKTVP